MLTTSVWRPKKVSFVVMWKKLLETLELEDAVPSYEKIFLSCIQRHIPLDDTSVNENNKCEGGENHFHVTRHQDCIKTCDQYALWYDRR